MTCVSVFIFFLVDSHEPVFVFDTGDILFENRTIHGNLTVSMSPYDELILAFARRNIGRMAHLGHTVAPVDSDITHLTLPATDTIPFTTHALISTDPTLHEMIVIEANAPIAHQSHAKKTVCERATVFMVSSADLTGREAFIIGLNANSEVILEIEIP